MTNYLEEAFGPIDADNRSGVLSDTWGHLHPERDRWYEGYMIFTYGAWGDLVLIDADWEDLSDSPWLNDDMHEYWHELVDDKALERGHVYRFDGVYCRHLMYDPEQLARAKEGHAYEIEQGFFPAGSEPDLSGLGEIGVWEFSGSYSDIKLS